MLSTYSDRAIPSKWEISLNSFSMILSLATFFHRTSEVSTMGWVGSGEDFCWLGWVGSRNFGLGFEKVTHDQLCGHVMLPPQHVCNGLASPADESMLTRDIGV